ncbi:hypothetical protein TSA1_27520 [Bradyrhizobium nitroreducens]|uniref:Uncharacterized protein n=1 Tax=Bradyrhizobium nitroreducens TaxID=709803 RepID=A0A2M6UHK3_9BRAD|nr:hypothetical protein [Bradyrhizobium nitroreducens]PIT04104.1 hypothetical protein TSA1_27520 [Bradyrhizobium nitroreducens]
MKPKPSPKLPNPKPRSDNEGVPRKMLIDNSSEASAENRDLVHGDSGTIGLPTKPGDLSKDD